ncbi:GSCOCG00001223001-RA-CDS [Cotesia congregata]|nr:GSCOCG00001223001-RA-CDS [Cotesia congregata]
MFNDRSSCWTRCSLNTTSTAVSRSRLLETRPANSRKVAAPRASVKPLMRRTPTPMGRLEDVTAVLSPVLVSLPRTRALL